MNSKLDLNSIFKGCVAILCVLAMMPLFASSTHIYIAPSMESLNAQQRAEVQYLLDVYPSFSSDALSVNKASNLKHMLLGLPAQGQKRVFVMASEDTMALAPVELKAWQQLLARENIQLSVWDWQSTNNETLQQLALLSGGHYINAKQTVEPFRDMSIVLSQMFNTAFLPGKLSQGIQFDKGINKVSLVIFHSKGSKNIYLEPPNQILLSTKNTPSSVHWQSYPQYSIITINKPAAGLWRVIGSKDARNQQWVSSNKGIEFSNFPHFIFQQQQLNLSLHMKGVKQLQSSLVNSDGEKLNSALLGSAKDTTVKGFRYQFEPKALTPGQYEINFLVKGDGWQRSYPRYVQVLAAPLVTQTHANSEAAGYTTELQSQLQSALIDPSTLMVTADVNNLDREHQETVDLAAAGDRWQAVLPKITTAENYQFSINAEAKTWSGQSLQFVFPEQTAAGAWPIQQAEKSNLTPMVMAGNLPHVAKRVGLTASFVQSAVDAKAPVIKKRKRILPLIQQRHERSLRQMKLRKESPVVKPQPVVAVVATPKEEEQESAGWGMFILTVIICWLLLAGIGFGVMFAWRRYMAKQVKIIEEGMTL